MTVIKLPSTPARKEMFCSTCGCMHIWLGLNIVDKCLVLRIAGSTGCTPTTNYGGCDQICLPSGNNNQKRCACATGFVLKSDGTGCEGEYFLQVFICLPPTNEVWGQGSVFTRVCYSVHRGVSV